jgi:alkylation response protein AidB-like acyl-CoA dehydrogenase
MNTAEFNQIIESVRKMALKEIPTFQKEEFYGTLPRGLFDSMANLGLTGLSISEQGGGMGAPAKLIAAVLEEIAQVDLGPSIFLSVHLMVSKMIETFGTASQKEKYLAGMIEGKLLAAFGLTEANAGSDASAIKTAAKETPTGFVLNGSKIYITSAGWADLYVVFAKMPDGKMSAFIVPAKTKGLVISPPEKKMGCELSPIATLTFENMELPKEALLGEVGQGYKVALNGLAGGRVSIAACANGLSKSALQRSLDFLKEREQFGKPLIEMQGLQFMLADMRIKLETARLITAQAADKIDGGASQGDQRLFSSIAKCYATDSAMSVTTDAVQLFGGAGYIKEYQVERLMRDAKMLQIVEGTNQIQRMIIAREMSAPGHLV